MTPAPAPRKRRIAIWQIGVVLGVVVLLWAGLLYAFGVSTPDIFGPASVGFSFDNRTDTEFCEVNVRGVARPGVCLDVFEAQKVSGTGRDCDNEKHRPITVVLTVLETAEEVYVANTTCGEMDDTNGRFVIAEDAGEYIIIDPFGDVTRTPR